MEKSAVAMGLVFLLAVPAALICGHIQGENYERAIRRPGWVHDIRTEPPGGRVYNCCKMYHLLALEVYHVPVPWEWVTENTRIAGTGVLKACWPDGRESDEVTFTFEKRESIVLTPSRISDESRDARILRLAAQNRELKRLLRSPP